MLASTCSMRRWIDPREKDLSRELTALNRLPSIATIAWAKRFRLRHSATNCRQTERIAGPLSLRKSAIVLKSVLALNKALHQETPTQSIRILTQPTFHTASAQLRHTQRSGFAALQARGRIEAPANGYLAAGSTRLRHANRSACVACSAIALRRTPRPGFRRIPSGWRLREAGCRTEFL